MKSYFVGVFGLVLVVAASSVEAQTYERYDSRYSTGIESASEQPYYDYARVIRVDPVLDRGYRNVPAQTRRCYQRQDRGRYTSDPYMGGYRDDGYYRDRSGYGRDYGRDSGRVAAGVIGGIAGAVIGSKVGGGSGRYVSTTVGSVLGSMAGQEIYEQRQRERVGTVRVCDPEPVRAGYGGGEGYDERYGYDGNGVSMYDVTYEYNGRRYQRRMDYHPGDRLRVRVDVSPQ